MIGNPTRLKINFGQNQFIVNASEMTYDKVVELAEKVADIRRSHSLFAKYPLEEEETRDKWRERISPLMEQEALRKEGESVEDHLKRLFEAKVDTHELSYDIIVSVAEVFRLNVPSKADFKNTPWLGVKAFIYDVLNMADIPAEDFYPKKPVLA